MHIFLFKIEPRKLRVYLATLAQKLGDFTTMAFQPLTLMWHATGRPDIFKKITISETEINDGNYFTLTGVRCPLLRVETPFRDDEIFHGTLLSKGGETLSPQNACDEYIEQLKYRREKNELIQDLRCNGRTLSKNWVRAIGGTWVLELAAIRMDSVPSLITEDKRISGLEREIKELREKNAILQSGKGALQEALDRSSLQSAEKIQRLNKEISRLKTSETENKLFQESMGIARKQGAVIDDMDRENKKLKESISVLQSDKEALDKTIAQLRDMNESQRIKCNLIDVENKELKKKAIVREERVVDLKSKRDALDRSLTQLRSNIQGVCIASYKEIEELKTSREYVSRLRHTICPNKKYWIDEVKQKHSEKLKDLVKALGKKHVAKREKLIAEKEMFTKRVFELTEEIASLKQVDDSKSQVQSLKLQLAAEKRISQKYARDLQERDNQQSVLTAM